MRSTILVLFVVMETFATGRVAAQQNEAERTALARSLFREGVELAEQEKFAEAADRFERAYSLKPTPGVAFNWAQALVRNGELVEASERLRDVVGNPEASAEIGDAAKTLLQQTEERIAHLTVRLRETEGDPEVRLDGERLEPAAVGVAIPRDPGSHTAEVRRGTETVDRETVTLEEGASAEIELAPGPADQAATGADARTAIAPDAGDATMRDEADDGGVLTSWWLWTGVAVVVVGALATGLTVGGVFDSPAPVEGNTMPGVLEWP